MASLAELYGRLKKNWPEQDFGPDDSMIASAIRNPAEAARRMYGSAVEGLPTMYDEPQTQLYKSLSSLAGMINPVGRQMPGTLAAINASHGSPHAFTKFRLANIGTGEGAQAYGHGLYFGEGFDSPVAMSYAPRDPAFEAALLKKYNEAERMGNYPALQVYEDYMMHKTPANMESAIAEYGFTGKDLDAAMKAHQFASKEYQKQKTSNLYNVSLRWPDAAREAADPLGPQHFLDWDAPLSQQKQFLEALTPEKMGLTLRHPEDGGFMSYVGSTGKPIGLQMKGATPEKFRERWLNRLAEIGNQEQGAGRAIGYLGGTSTTGELAPAVSNALRQAGIPGIRYLDAGSRGAGAGTSNYVVFDEDIPEIVTRNNRSLADLLRR